MIGYAMFLLVSGVIAAGIAGFDRGKTAVISTGALAIVMVVMAFLASSEKKGVRKIGAHLGMGLPLIFAGLFVQRHLINVGKPLEAAWVAANPGKEIVHTQFQSPVQAVLFPVLIVGSIIAFVLILKARPPVPAPE